MKKIALLLIILSGFFVLRGQEYNYFYYKGNVIALPIHSNECLVFFEDGTSLDSIRNAGFSIGNTITMSDSSIFCVKVPNIRYAQQESESILQSIQGIKAIEPIIGFENDTNEVLVSNRFYVKLKQLSDTIRLKEFANQYKVRVEHPISYCDLWYALSTTKESFNSIACANFFYESGAFQDIDPGFLFDFRSNCVSDLYFSVEQWGLNSENYGINACGAWGITTGVPNIRVAIVDSGLDLTH